MSKSIRAGVLTQIKELSHLSRLSYLCNIKGRAKGILMYLFYVLD